MQSSANITQRKQSVLLFMFYKICSTKLNLLSEGKKTNNTAKKTNNTKALKTKRTVKIETKAVETKRTQSTWQRLHDSWKDRCRTQAVIAGLLLQ